MRWWFLCLLCACQTPSSPWAEAVDDLDTRITQATQRVAATPASWRSSEALVGLLHQRARLTGDWSDHATADGVLDAAFEHAPPGGGPLLARAEQHLGLHRVADAAADVATVAAQPLHTPGQALRLDSIRADLALQRGDLDEAESILGTLEAGHPTVSSVTGLARLAIARGNPEEADRWFAIGETRYHGSEGEPLAWVALQRGILDANAGRHEQALAHYQTADERLGGWWLVQEHQANSLLALGRPEDALPLYEASVASHPEPRVLRALAAQLGATRRAVRLKLRANAIDAERADRFPQTVAGHTH